MNPESAVRTGIELAVKNFSNAQLAALLLCVQMDADPRDKAFDYNAVKGLFTQDDGTKMHQTTKAALYQVVNQRLS